MTRYIRSSYSVDLRESLPISSMMSENKSMCGAYVMWSARRCACTVYSYLLQRTVITTMLRPRYCAGQPCLDPPRQWKWISLLPFPPSPSPSREHLHPRRPLSKAGATPTSAQVLARISHPALGSFGHLESSRIWPKRIAQNRLLPRPPLPSPSPAKPASQHPRSPRVE